tara:strand:- start:17 stop:367 length:351 start_codon:yes stop_codon:yes gene_type:complete
MTLTTRQLAVLNHVLEDGQAWADNAIKEEHVLAKVAKYEADYDESVAKGSYKTRKQREDADAKARQDAYDNATYDVKRQRSYPPIGDQLDALWKGGDDAAAMKVIVDKVKSDNPKG